MPQIALTLRHEDGTISEHIFDLQGDLDTLDGIDEAIEQFKNAALPQVEQQLLAQAQERLVAQEKKTVPDCQRQ